MRVFAAMLALAAATGFAAPVSAGAVKLKAAGSLKAALTEVVDSFSASNGSTVEAEFAPSGLLREKISAGAETDLFASANMKHPQALAEERGGEVVPFATNRLCALVAPGVEATSDTLLTQLLSDDVRVGISTPKADPSGDYAWQLFDKAEALQTDAADRLKGKALQLTGGPDSAKPPEGRLVYAWVMEEGQADIFLTYCTNAVLAQREVPDLNIVQVPPELSVGATYGLIVLGGKVEAQNLADFIVSAEGQAILSSYGFGPPG